MGLLLGCGGVAGASEGPDPYRRCAACHLVDGTGVPGLFPPLAGHVERYFSTPEGREYLGRLVIGGASGAIEVKGVRYAGEMPAVVADLSDAEIADLLNGLVRRFGGGEAKPGRLFSGRDVSRMRAAGRLTREQRASLRKSALAGAGQP
ncbi:MAG: cytochrome c [Proteobacteria bacterium]|nr:cytochrome c [Pseudomonadota bacterium]